MDSDCFGWIRAKMRIPTVNSFYCTFLYSMTYSPLLKLQPPIYGLSYEEHCHHFFFFPLFVFIYWSWILDVALWTGRQAHRPWFTGHPMRIEAKERQLSWEKTTTKIAKMCPQFWGQQIQVCGRWISTLADLVWQKDSLPSNYIRAGTKENREAINRYSIFVNMDIRLIYTNTCHDAVGRVLIPSQANI